MANFSSWTEGILLTTAALLCIIFIFGAMDAQYNQKYASNIATGLNDTSGAENLFVSNEANLQNQTNNGIVGFNALGVSLTTSYTMFQITVNIIWSFISGGFLENLINAFNLGIAGTFLAIALRAIWFLGLIYFLLYLLFKVRS
jgi:hypothetical protein